MCFFLAPYSSRAAARWCPDPHFRAAIMKENISPVRDSKGSFFDRCHFSSRIFEVRFNAIRVYGRPASSSLVKRSSNLTRSGPLADSSIKNDRYLCRAERM